MINFLRYLDTQSGEDKRGFIVHYPANSGKSAFARRAAGLRPGIHYLDLLDACLNDPNLPAIPQCGFEFLKNTLLGLSVRAETVLVDNPDFLFNTWPSDDKHALLHWLKVQLRSPAVSATTFAFFIQSDEILAAAQFNNSAGQPRVLTLNQFAAI